jgi:hypothetical protein
MKHDILYDNGELVTASKECRDRMGFKKGKTFIRNLYLGGKSVGVTITEWHTTHKTVSVNDGEYRRAYIYPNGHKVLDGSSSIFCQ